MPNLGNTQSARQSKSRSRKPSTTIRRMRDLSAREGRIVLAEYLEENPPLIMNVGMGTKLINYYRKASSTDVSPGEVFVSIALLLYRVFIYVFILER